MSAIFVDTVEHAQIHLMNIHVGHVLCVKKQTLQNLAAKLLILSINNPRLSINNPRFQCRPNSAAKPVGNKAT